MFVAGYFLWSEPMMKSQGTPHSWNLLFYAQNTRASLFQGHAFRLYALKPGLVVLWQGIHGAQKLAILQAITFVGLPAGFSHPENALSSCYSVCQKRLPALSTFQNHLT
jgi:hypothetical protein